MRTRGLLGLFALCATLSAFGPRLWAAPLGTAFTYQGWLATSGQLASGSYDLRLILYDAPAGGSQVGVMLTNAAVLVSGGLFALPVDFGEGVLTGSARWLELAVRTNSGGTFITLSPRQPLNPAPYALYAPSAGSAVSAASASGVVPNGVTTASLQQNAVTSDKIANGTITTGDLSPALASGTFWRLDGNTGTTPGSHFVGTADDQPLEFKVNGLRVWRAEMAGDSNDPDTSRDGAPNLIGGAPINYVAPGVVGATIAGGGGTNFYGMVVSNSVRAFFSTISGGYDNWVGSNSGLSVIAGGVYNAISNNADSSVIGGGFDNSVGASSTTGTIAGGSGNTIGTNSGYSTIGGGSDNTVTDSARYATIPGGRSNTATNYAFAAGYNAQANHRGAFVWSDGRGTATASAASNSVTMRASGGYRFFTGAGSAGASLAAGATSWATMSDRALEKDFAPVDNAEILEQLAAVPVQRWRYQWEETDGSPHLGPVAQDFKAAFYPGRDDKTITTLEFDGVALAAIQGLNRKLEDRSQKLEASNAALEKEVAELKALVKALTVKVGNGGQ